MEEEKFKIIAKTEGYETRYIIVDSKNNDVVLDDAQGYGYKTKQKAAKAAWWKYKKGKEKSEALNKEMRKFFAEHENISDFISEILEINFKEFYTGENTFDDVIKAVKTEFDVDITKKHIKYVQNNM